MSEYGIAWLVIAIAALIGATILYRLMSSLQRPAIRILLVALVLTFFLVPAPVPDYESQLAPAFVVLIFEAFFQTDGNPLISGRILVIALLLTVVLTALGRYLYQRLVPPPSN